MAEAFSDDRIQIFQDWIDGKLHHYPLGYDADKDARIIVGGFLATITARDKRIEELEKIVKDQCDPEEYDALIFERNNQTAVIERLRGALTKIAAFTDEAANDYLEKYSKYAAFDEPDSVQIARQALDAGKEKK